MMEDITLNINIRGKQITESIKEYHLYFLEKTLTNMIDSYM